ncbi:protein EXECUTER 1, chloroplastic-like [Apium graveolens]|uniref:protein EXECUTER 1, chloroplastic-like n=1 Tax=Apium graveolens TaxID=4045 RepID=UPI003D7BA03D
MAANSLRKKLLLSMGMARTSLLSLNIFTLFASKTRTNSLAAHSQSSRLLSYVETNRISLVVNACCNVQNICYEQEGWWVGISGEPKCPYGQIIHISADTSAEQGRYLARSYSPWQLATAKNGTPVFEIYVTYGLEGECKEQAICIKHKAACPNSLGSSLDRNTLLGKFSLTRPGSKTDQATGAAADLLVEKAVVFIDFTAGDAVEEIPHTCNEKVLRVPATLERKECFSFCLTLEEDRDQHVSGDHNHEVYRTTHHDFFKFVDLVGRGTPIKNISPKEDQEKYFSILLSRARNQLPLLSQVTYFNRIDIPTSSDPLNGLYIGSNGYLATEVIQLRKLFGPWPEVGSIKNDSEPELCEYVEAVNLTGDYDMPAGQVALRAKVGDKYKLRPDIDLKEMYGAVARYKGKGRLPGFENSEWVDVDVLIIGKKHQRRDGIAIAVLYSASEYYFLKFFKQLKLQSLQESH